MQNYFDIHCHILPDVDDGAKNLDETKRGDVLLQNTFRKNTGMTGLTGYRGITLENTGD